jgi:hypothetical protein
MPRAQLEDGTPLSEIQQILFEESQSRNRQQSFEPHQDPPPPPPQSQSRQVRFEEPIPTPVPVMVDVDPVGAIQQSMKVSSYENTGQPDKKSVARQIMNSLIVSFVVFVALYIFPFLQSTPLEYRASTMKIFVIALGMGIAVLYIQKTLQ